MHKSLTSYYLGKLKSNLEIFKHLNKTFKLQVTHKLEAFLLSFGKFAKLHLS